MYVVKCRNCALISARVFQSEEDRQRMDEIFFDETHLHEENESRTIRDFTEVLELVKNYGGFGKLLDVGCGTGYFLKCALDRGWQAEGVDIAANAVKHANKLGLNVRNSSLEKASYPSSYFDAVTQLGLIEHVESPRTLLTETNRILRHGGVLVIFTPNAASLFHLMADWFYKVSGSHFAIKKIFYSRHLFYFTRRTLVEMLTTTGFRVKELRLVGLDLDRQVFSLFRQQQWARSRVVKMISNLVLAVARMTGMETHMIVYAVKER
jgi:2-polyprenyl-3-methyl-5-hydroxy-6-metoxy-1,4-benzoquinol methylase